MIDREKVIKGLQICSSITEGEACPNDCPYYREVCYGYDQLMRDALELLEQQEAVKPKKIKGFNPPLYVQFKFVCDNCQSDLIQGQPYCSGCGRLVKWDG